MQKIVQVRLRESNLHFFYLVSGAELKVGDYVIVEADRAQEYGQVISDPEIISDDKIEKNLRKVIRVANSQDLKQIQENKQKVKQAFDICTKKIDEHKMEMKLVDVEYFFDRSKIVFYFTADGRVDFRELVKDLARIFKARIELKQIGVRDEAKLFGGFGFCGRELCCVKFLKNFEPVTIKMAKEQGLPLNPPKLSGVCGRLMCCLSYEYKTYKELSKDLPKEGDRINTPDGRGRVISVNILKRKATVEVGQECRQIEVSFK